jgi:hypothetical protein
MRVILINYNALHQNSLISMADSIEHRSCKGIWKYALLFQLTIGFISIFEKSALLSQTSKGESNNILAEKSKNNTCSLG